MKFAFKLSIIFLAVPILCWGKEIIVLSYTSSPDYALLAQDILTRELNFPKNFIQLRPQKNCRAVEAVVQICFEKTSAFKILAFDRHMAVQTFNVFHQQFIDEKWGQK